MWLECTRWQLWGSCCSPSALKDVGLFAENSRIRAETSHQEQGLLDKVGVAKYSLWYLFIFFCLRCISFAVNIIYHLSGSNSSGRGLLTASLLLYSFPLITATGTAWEKTVHEVPLLSLC